MAMLKRWYGVVALFAAIAAIGWNARGVLGRALGSKADAASVAVDHAELVTDHERLVRVEQRVDDIHEDVAGVRADLRAFAAGHPLPTLTPEMKK